MNTMSISRRKFAQLLGAGAAVAIVKPAFSLPTETVASPPVGRSRPQATSTSTGVVRLSSNENPYGPSPSLRRARRSQGGLNLLMTRSTHRTS